MAPAPITASSPWVRTTLAPAPTSTSLSVQSGPTTASSATTVAPSSWTPGRIVTSRLEHDVDVDPGGRRVDDRDAVAHPAVEDPAVQLRRERGELDAVVGALGLQHVVDPVRADALGRPRGRCATTSVR